MNVIERENRHCTDTGCEAEMSIQWIYRLSNVTVLGKGKLKKAVSFLSRQAQQRTCRGQRFLAGAGWTFLQKCCQWKMHHQKITNLNCPWCQHIVISLNEGESTLTSLWQKIKKGMIKLRDQWRYKKKVFGFYK